MKKIILMVVSFAFFMSGCATTTGPKVTSEEVRLARQRLEAKAVRHKYDQLQRVSDIGYNIISNLPGEEGSKKYPYLGIKVAKITNSLKEAYSISDDFDGVIIVTIVKESPAQKAGLLPGDIIVKIGGYGVRNITGFGNAVSSSKLKDSASVEIEIIRQGLYQRVICGVEKVPREVAFDMVDDQEINAGASYDKVVVTYGLMNFITSDDEIAVVLGHELAHIMRGHIAKTSGVQILTGLAVIGLGVVSEYFQPGTAAQVMRAASGASEIFSRSYSRDLEREADYFGLKYTKSAGYDYTVAVNLWERFAVEVPKSMALNFLNTHPTSPERSVRLEKIIEELKGQEEDAAGAFLQ